MSSVDFRPYIPSKSNTPIFVAGSDGNEVVYIDSYERYRLYYYFECEDSDRSQSLDVALSINGKLVSTRSLNTPKSGDRNWNYYLSGSFQPGTYTIKLVLDPYNKIEEANENNNVYSRTITVSGNSNYLVKTYWGQSDYIFEDPIKINSACPVEPGESTPCVTGCSNTAAALIFHYFAQKGYNFTLQLDNSDVNNRNPNITIDSSALNAQKYSYMPFSEVNEKLEVFEYNSSEDIAALVFASGVIAGAKYTKTATSTSLSGIQKVFKRAGFQDVKIAYSNSTLINSNGTFTYDGWNKIKNNIAAGKPLILSVRTPNHAVVIDGYDSATDKIHINFGWGIFNNKSYYESYSLDAGSGWYSSSECAEMSVSGLLYDITPDTVTPTISVSKSQPSDEFVYLTATFNDNVEVYEKYYQLGVTTGEWIEYTGAVKVDSNIPVYFKAVDKAKNTRIQSYSVSSILQMSADKNGVLFRNLSGTNHIVEYSTDNFTNVLQLKTSGTAVNSYGMPYGVYQWRVSNEKNQYIGNNFFSDNLNEPEALVSQANGNDDIFFASADRIWGGGSIAQHNGTLHGWGGTNERVSLKGKNKLTDIFHGSTDANVLVMTDSANGDALFVDDVFTELGSQARLSMIDEIRAGAGDDVIDLTSQVFPHYNDGVTVYGGLGDDTIWANGGYNTLFGDAGNDRIVGSSNYDVISGGSGNDSLHGGGGKDVFCFGENWGHDTVEQLYGGSVILWFKEDCNGSWDASNMIFSDGINSVRVSGVSADDVDIYWGNTNAVAAGAFSDAASEFIYEDPNRGMLA